MNTFEQAGEARLLAAEGTIHLGRAIAAGFRAALVALARVLAANHASRGGHFLPGG